MQTVFFAYAMLCAGAVIGTVLCIMGIFYKRHWTRAEKWLSSAILLFVGIRFAQSVFTVLNQSVVVNQDRGAGVVVASFSFLIVLGGLIWAGAFHALYVRFFKRDPERERDSP